MARYLSFHAGSEGKMTRKTIKGLSGHTFRKTEQRYKNHGNEDIDTSLTKYNSDWISQEGKSLDEVVNERLEKDYKGKRALRKDAVVVREIIVQASPSVYEGLTLKQKRKKAVDFTNDSLKWFAKEFGRENVIGASLHLDETNPHTHVAIMPMTKDGRISQKDFFKGPSDLKRMHRQYRKHMNDLGWEFEEENKYENVDGVSLPKYKANAKEIEKKREEQTEAIRGLLSDDEIREEARDIVLNDVLREERERIERKAELQKEKEKELNNRERQLDEREKQQDKRDVEQDKRDVEQDNREDLLNYFDDSLTERHKMLRSMEKGFEGVALGVLKGDKNRQHAYKMIEQQGLVQVAQKNNPNAILNTMTGSLQDVIDGHRYLQVSPNQMIQDDGPER